MFDKDQQIVKKDSPVPATKDPLESIDLTSEQIRDVLLNAGAKSVAENLPFVNRLFGLVERVDQEVREEKLKMLLGQFLNHFEDIDKALGQLKTLLGTRAGLILFQKILHIIDGGDADQEWIDLLARALRYVSGPDIETQFAERSYMLSLIARLSSHALILLNKFDQWRRVSFGSSSTTMSGQTIIGGWEKIAAEFFSKATGVTDTATKARIAHAFLDLQNNGMTHIDGSKNLTTTPIGEGLRKAIT